MPAGPLRGGPRPPSLTISFFPDVFDQHPHVRTVGWERLTERLTRFPVQSNTRDKRCLPCWTPASFEPDEPATAEHVTALSCLVLDIDEGLDIDTSWAQTEPYTAALHTSWSHSPDAPRFRLVLPLARPVPGTRWTQVWAAAVEGLSLPIDRKCVNANRRYLLPAPPSEDVEHCSLVRTTDLALDLVPLQRSPPPRRHTPTRRIVVPHYLMERAARKRLAWNPDARARLAETLGGQIRGSGRTQRAEHIPCPGCGRSSVWFLLAPEQATRARCNHQNSCGWSGPVTDLLGSTP